MGEAVCRMIFRRDTQRSTTSDVGAIDDLRGTLSVKETFKGANVLITGVTDYVGSLLLEHLLRVCPDVGTVYVLIRSKKNMSSKERLEKLLSSGLFHHLWDRTDLLHKISAVEGDITQEDLGLKPHMKAELLERVNFVMHSAAAVALDDPIKDTLRNNYLSTYQLLELCQQMTNLQSYAHVSTAYVNINFESGSVVKEKVYPLKQGDQIITHNQIVPELLRLDEEEATLKAEVLMNRFNYPNTYCLGKRFTEELVAGYFARGMPCCIIRPSLITGVERDPYPGYIGNLAGGAGFAISFAVGFFEWNALDWTGSGVCDIVPGDIVSSVTIAAAASMAKSRVKEEEIPVFHACTSTSYPISNGEMFTMGRWFFEKEPAPYCLLWGSYPQFPPSYKPNAWRVYLGKMITAAKVHMACWLMRYMGKDKLANRLYTGWKAWDFGNDARYDMNLFFSVNNVNKLDTMLVEEEKEDIRVMFTPQKSEWARYFRTYLAAIKELYLKSPLIDHSDHDFQYIAPCDPPVRLSSVSSASSTTRRTSDNLEDGNHEAARKWSSCSARSIQAEACNLRSKITDDNANAGSSDESENGSAASDVLISSLSEGSMPSGCHDQVPDVNMLKDKDL